MPVQRMNASTRSIRSAESISASISAPTAGWSRALVINTVSRSGVSGRRMRIGSSVECQSFDGGQPLDRCCEQVLGLRARRAEPR